MRRVVLVRYGEIAVKTGRVRAELESRLVYNIVIGLREAGISRQQATVERADGRVLVYLHDPSVLEKAVDVIRRVFGVKSISPAVEIRFEKLEDICKVAEDLWKDVVKDRTFAVRCHRVGKHSFTSKDVEARVGEVLRPYARGVNLENPDIELYVEIRGDTAYLYDSVLEGPGGLPLGSEGRALALVSGGFDSPVAAWFVMRRGVAVDFLTVSLAGELDLLPALRVIAHLVDRWCIGYDPVVYVVHAEELVKEIREKVNLELWNVVYKRCLLYIAERIVEKERGYRAIVTGDIIGQVSSQTLDNIYSSQHGIRIPILRPLIGFDKDDVMKYAQLIGTYELSKQVAEYCAIFSTKPRTWSTPEEIDLEFFKVKKVVDKIIENNVRKLRKKELLEIVSSAHVETYDVQEIPQNAVIIDVRPRHVPKLRVDNVPVIETSIDNVFDIVKSLDKSKKILIYCTSPLVSRYVARKLRELGYEAYSLVRY